MSATTAGGRHRDGAGSAPRGDEGPVHGPALNARLQWGGGRRVPVLLQTEASECGLACLGMLLGAHGVSTDLPTLRGRHGPVPHGMSVADFVDMAEREQLVTRAVQLEMSDLPQLRLPAMLHWDMAHFVVLVALRGRQAVIHDPAIGERTLGLDEFGEHFTGVAVEAWPAGGFARRDEARAVSLRQLVGRVSGLGATLWRVLALSLAVEALALLSPLFAQWVVDHVIVARDASLLTTLGLGFVLVLLIQQGLQLMRSWVLLRVGTQLRVQWRSNVLSHLMRLPLDYFARRHLGDLMSRFESVGNIQRVLTSTFVEAGIDGLMVLLTFGLMLAYSPVLAGFAALSVVLYAVLRQALYGPSRAAASDRLIRAALEQSHLLESLRGMRAIRLFARQHERLASWQSLMVADVNADVRAQRLDVIYQAARRTLSGAAALGLMWLGARSVMAGELTVGMLLAFVAYRTQFDTRATELINRWFELRMLGLDAQRLGDIVLTPTEPEQRRPRREPAAGATAPPAITLQALGFRYAGTGPDVLADIDLHIPAGQSVAIAGPSGCGKSTLVQLLLGIFTPTQGQVLIDGRALESSAVQAWRRQVGTVMQDDVLFAGTIAENIAFFDPRPDTARIESCARLAEVHEDVTALPMGYHTLVGDMGAALSGGQKQRVLLARALYGRPRVLVLDEATSQLDVAREARIGQAIAAMSLTRIVVAHRPQTLALVDRVIELRDGRIVHDESSAEHLARLQRHWVAPR
ncbi:peptidase domain-containing ABC transporter [Pseudaquabacterium rugosum]|uniref:Peptidase domain-containing ABC transporter n=1 Tax=Pseudaquabacterium rugosum TaxID=2984194 RepID=A0ABU9B8N8_9BURK